MAGTVKTDQDIDTATTVGFGVGPRDAIDGADGAEREVRVERDRSAPRSRTDQQRNAEIASTSSAPELIGLAERMGISTEDAVRFVLNHLSDRHLSAAVVEPESW